jgi:hypothetical protein
MMTSIGETFRVRPWVADAGKAGIGGGRPLPMFGFAPPQNSHAPVVERE